MRTTRPSSSCLPVEHALAEHRQGRRPDASCDEGADDHPGRGAENRAGRGKSQRLDSGQQRRLPAAAAVPGEAPAGGLEVAAERRRRQDREREHEHCGLTADEGEPVARPPARRLCLPELLDGRDDIERDRLGLQLRPSLRHVVRQPVDLPEPRPARPERRDPGVAAVDPRERGRLGEGAHAFGEEERRRRRTVVARRGRDGRADLRVLEGVVRGREEVAREHPRGQRRLADLDEPKPVGLRQPALAPQPEHLAALRPALARQTAGADVHPAAEPLDAAEARELPRDRRLAEEDDGGAGRQVDVRQRSAHARVERGLWLAALTGDAEPDGADRARAVRDALDRLRQRAVLGDRRRDLDADEERRADCDAEDDDEAGAARPAEPPAREPEHVLRRAEHRGRA